MQVTEEFKGFRNIDDWRVVGSSTIIVGDPLALFPIIERAGQRSSQPSNFSLLEGLTMHAWKLEQINSWPYQMPENKSHTYEYIYVQMILPSILCHYFKILQSKPTPLIKSHTHSLPRACIWRDIYIYFYIIYDPWIMSIKSVWCLHLNKKRLEVYGTVCGFRLDLFALEKGFSLKRKKTRMKIPP